MPRAQLLSTMLVLAAGAWAAGDAARAMPDADTLTYTVRFPDPASHTLEVEAVVPTAGAAQVELMMPVWTPGSYLVREYARNVEAIAASAPGGEPLPITKITKNRWRLTTAGHAEVVVRYRLYAREMSVRGNFVDHELAVLNGAATFITLAGGHNRPHLVTLVPPPAWKTSVTALAALPGEHRYRASDYDQLVDSPLLLGNPVLHTIEHAGKRHLLANQGESEIWDGPRSAADVAKLVSVQSDFWSEVPFERFVFLNVIAEGSGGLEHADSFLVMTSRWKARTREGWLDWLGVVSHELFHAWNVKRLRPRELGPFDYEAEIYTPSLWIAEGITSYYDDLLVHRAGLSTRKEYLTRLSRDVERLQEHPGRLVQPVVDASFDTWIKFYRRDENFANAGVSYYTKGALTGFLLDVKIRRATQGRASLDTVMRRAWERWSGPSGYGHDEFLALLSEVAGEPLGPWLERALNTTEELDYGEALAFYGLRFKPAKPRERDPGEDEEDEETAGWLGIETEVKEGRLVVTEVKRGTPGQAAGLNVEDEILAVAGYRVPPEKWAERLKAFPPGAASELLVARRERLVTLPVVFGEKPTRWRLEVDPAATSEQRARLDAWLGPAAAPAGAGAQPSSVQQRSVSSASSTANAPR